MVKVTVGTNTRRVQIIVEDTQTLRQTLSEQEVDYSRATVHLDGIPVGLGDLDKSYATLGITEACYLLAVVKADNAYFVLVTR